MPHYTYLIVGGGMTAAQAVRGIREVDRNGGIGLISQEPDPPYGRPPLSKGLWKGQSVDGIWLKTEEESLSLHLGHTVRSLDPVAKRVVDEQGAVYKFDKCLLATGGTPRRLPSAGDMVIYFRTVQDYRRRRELAGRRRHFVVIGGGFIGSEIAAALAMNGERVTIVYPEEGIGWRVFPPDLCRFIGEYYRDKGVETIAGESIVDIQKQGVQSVLKTQAGREIVADAIVAGIGIQPNVELAQQAGLTVEDGILVNETLQTGHPDIYAAGDVASFYNPALGKRLRVEHEDNANTMGRLAGRSMAGQAAPYHHLPFFYSDLFDLGYEAVGELNPSLELVADWKEPFREGVIYYLQNGRIRGVLLWNVWEQVDAARRLIAQPGPYHPADLKGRLPESR